MDLSTDQPTMRAILQILYGKNGAILGAVLFPWQQTIAWVIRKMGTLLADFLVLMFTTWKVCRI